MYINLQLNEYIEIILNNSIINIDINLHSLQIRKEENIIIIENYENTYNTIKKLDIYFYPDSVLKFVNNNNKLLIYVDNILECKINNDIIQIDISENDVTKKGNIQNIANKINICHVEDNEIDLICD